MESWGGDSAPVSSSRSPPHPNHAAKRVRDPLIALETPLAAPKTPDGTGALGQDTCQTGL